MSDTSTEPAGAERPESVDARPVAARRGPLGAWWVGKYGYRLLVEIVICGGLLMLYRAIRMFTKSNLGEAFRNAREIVRLERSLGMPFEDDINAWLLDHTWAVKGLNWYYVLFHFPVAIGFLLWLYVFHVERYRPWRNLMAFVTMAALVIHLLYPLAPPRMMNGFVDTMEAFGPSIYNGNAFKGAANQFAAMPSLHFGWALIEAIAVISVSRHAWRWLILAHPALMTLSIIGTANHWWIDAAAAGLIIAGAIAVWRVLMAWVGGRRWSWTRFRFETEAGLARLEAYANQRH